MNLKFLLCLLSLTITIVSAQTAEEKSPTARYLLTRGYIFPDSVVADSQKIKRWPDTLYYNTTYVAKLLGSPTIPVSFSRIEYVDGKYQVSPTISLGLG